MTEDWNEFYTEGQNVRISIAAKIIEVGSNYVTVETEDGDELDINGMWEIEDD